MKLLQGDCLELMKEIPDASVDMILCDPPYGTTACRWDIAIPFEPMWVQYRRIVRPDAAIVLFGCEPFSTALRASNLKDYRYDWIWEKEQGANFMNCRYQPYKVHEIISVFSIRRCRYYPQMTEGKARFSGSGTSGEVTHSTPKERRWNNGKYYPRSVIKFCTEKNRMKKYHPTQKPTALLEYLIRTYTQPGELVLDNCMGSGSTGVACVNTGRDFIGMELDPTYYQTACMRVKAAQEGATEKPRSGKRLESQTCIWESGEA